MISINNFLRPSTKSLLILVAVGLNLFANPIFATEKTGISETESMPLEIYWQHAIPTGLSNQLRLKDDTVNPGNPSDIYQRPNLWQNIPVSIVMTEVSEGISAGKLSKTIEFQNGDSAVVDVQIFKISKGKKGVEYLATIETNSPRIGKSKLRATAVNSLNQLDLGTSAEKLNPGVEAPNPNGTEGFPADYVRDALLVRLSK